MFQNNLISKPAEQDHSILSKGDEKMNAKNVVRFLSTAILFAFLLTACGAQKAPAATPSCPPFDSQTGWPLASQSDDGGCNYAPPAGNPTSTLPAAQQNAASTPTAQAVENKSAGSNATGTFAKFTPNWNGLSATPPTDDEVLNALGLNRNQLQMFQRESPSWEPALWVIELKPEFYGNVTINMPNGYQLTADTVDYENITFYGGDPAVTTAKLLHGTSVRWMPAYAASDAGKRLLDPALLVALENHFGRCYRNQNSGRADVPYFGRIGPYQTMPGNIYPEWTPPGLDETVVRTNMDAVAMLGGMLENWTIANGNAAWKNPNKGVSGADAQPHYWQQFCVPAITSGYVEIWNVAGQIGPNGVAVSAPGSYKYYSDDLKWLLQWSVDEMTYHSKND